MIDKDRNAKKRKTYANDYNTYILLEAPIFYEHTELAVCDCGGNN